MSGAIVRIYDSNNNWVASATCDSEGRYTTDPLPDGTYTLKVVNYWRSYHTWNGQTSAAISGADLTNINFVLH